MHQPEENAGASQLHTDALGEAGRDNADMLAHGLLGRQ
jgi:hypothetical protein